MNAAAGAFDGINKYIRITDIDEESRCYIDENPVSPKGELDDKYLVLENDILFARTGASTGKTYLYKKSDGKLYFAGFLIRISVNCDNNSTFVYNATLTDRYNRWVRLTSMRSGQPGINSQEYSSYKTYYPLLPEQNKIASFLKKLDQRIEKQRQFVELLKSYKRGALSKLFPQKDETTPKYRFSGFTEPWEQRKVREIANRYDNLRVPVAANLRVAGTTPYYGANGIQDYVEGYTHEGEFVLVAEDGANDLKNYPVKCVNGRIWVNNHAHVLQTMSQIADNQFLAYSINQTDIESLLVGGGRAKLNAETLMDIELTIPSIEEQRAIGVYLQHFDRLITLHQHNLNQFERIKAGLLQQLFI